MSEVEAAFAVDGDTARALVPDGLLSCKAATHLDAHVTLYSHGGNVLWVRSGRDARDDDALLFPSLYTLARCPTLLPIIGTAPPVIAKLTGGADLMAPGVSSQMLADLPDLPAGTLVAISSVAEPAVPRAVGQLAVSKRELADHGKAVVTLHAIGDHLWLAGTGEALEPIAGSSKPVSGRATPAATELPDVAALKVDDAPVASTSAPLSAKGPLQAHDRVLTPLRGRRHPAHSFAVRYCQQSSATAEGLPDHRIHARLSAHLAGAPGPL